MKRFLLFGIIALSVAGCAHVASTHGTVRWGREKDFTLRLTRHVDTIVRGPDDEEDQVLELHIQQWRIGESQRIPEDVTATLAVQRFGPPSVGETYRGWVIIESVTPQKIVATLNLVVTATTADNSYKQTERFRGTHTFDRP